MLQDITTIHMKSILSVVAALAVSSICLTAEQTINYPAEEPIFSIDFPDDWKIEAEESVSAASPDEIVHMELIALEAEATDEAMDLAKESLAEELEGIKWEGEPVTAEANGMDVTYLNGKVSIEDVDMAVNCVIFAPSGKDTFFMLFNVIPIAGLEKHGESVGKILGSVKAK